MLAEASIYSNSVIGIDAIKLWTPLNPSEVFNAVSDPAEVASSHLFSSYDFTENSSEYRFGKDSLFQNIGLNPPFDIFN